MAEGKTSPERVFWLCVIATSFSVAAVMVSASLRDTGMNPIATSVETIPVQVVSFVLILEKRS